MELNNLRETIINTNDDYWHQLIVGPYYHDRIYVDGDVEFSGTSHSHYCRAVLTSDVNISIEWGLVNEIDEDGDYPWAAFPDAKVRSEFVDVFYAGALVDRRVVYVVDGNRAILPNYTTVRTDGGEPHLSDGAVWEHQVSRWDYLLVQVLNQLSNNNEYQSYFSRSSLVRTAD